MTKLMMLKQGRGGGSAIFEKAMWTSVLAALVCLTVTVHNVEAGPILASSLGFCKDVPILKANMAPLNCCLTAPTKPPKRFVLPKHHKKVVRRPAHILAKDPVYVEKYNRAYKLMRELPATDPRSLLKQWHTHCSFCNEAFLQQLPPGPQGPESGVLLQLHYSWTFLPWHRMLIYFHEKILGSLINDPDFALPFWNWDNTIDDGAAAIPALFLEGFSVENAALQNQFRNKIHFPPKLLPLGYDSKLEANGTAPVLTDQQIKDENLCVIYNQVVNKISAQEFLGGALRNGTDFSVKEVGVTPGESGGAENLHNTAHEWVGLINNPEFPDNEDMGNFIYAGRDPIFYTHHANMDRLWDVWKTLPDTVTKSGSRKRRDPTDKDFLDTEFTFYDEHGDMVIVTQKQSLDSSKLGYTYSDTSASDSMWINHKPKTSTVMNAKIAGEWQPSDYPEVDPNADNTIGDSPQCYKLSRRAPTKADLKGTQTKRIDRLSEGVLLERVMIPHRLYLRFDVYVDFPGATRVTDLDQSDYVGTFTHLPSGLVTMTEGVSETVKRDEKYRIVDIRFSSATALKRLGINDPEQDITVTIVPKTRVDGVKVAFGNVKQEFC